jgi:hypothetical protein
MHHHVGVIDGTESYNTEAGGLYWYDVHTYVNENHQLPQKLFYGEQTQNTWTDRLATNNVQLLSCY